MSGYEDREAFRNLLYLEFTTFQILVSFYGRRPSTKNYEGVVKTGTELMARVERDYSETEERDKYLASIQRVLDAVEEAEAQLPEEARWQAERLPGERMSQWRKRISTIDSQTPD